MNNELNNYILITRNDINKLKIGHHIKYVNRGIVKDGGILLDVINPETPIYTELLLKSFNFWTINFLRFNIYMKTDSTENEKSLRELYKNEINERKKEFEKEINSKLNNINSNKNKYKIIFNQNNI
jgi:hypothetical protein